MAQRILLVDDDPHIAEVVEFALKAAGFEVDTAAGGQEAVDLFQKTAPDLIILDIGLPGRDGLWVCRQIRQASEVPVIFLSARDEEVDRVLGLTIGGDDYVTKPFSPRELVARTQAVLRRSQGPRPEPETPAEPAPALRQGRLRMDLESYETFWEDRPVELTATEFKILRVLCQRPKKVFLREELLVQVYPGTSVSDRTIDSHILHIRKKFQKIGAPDPIQTQHGLGYSLNLT
ncbi:MAG: response regulator transcription factor [Deltaproteobacteria bacterium]|jgi:two-component system OmpR family response regulator|nr:response regulator transcription factor [Deltaproteobacteria bacterium]